MSCGCGSRLRLRLWLGHRRWHAVTARCRDARQVPAAGAAAAAHRLGQQPPAQGVALRTGVDAVVVEDPRRARGHSVPVHELHPLSCRGRSARSPRSSRPRSLRCRAGGGWWPPPGSDRRRPGARSSSPRRERRGSWGRRWCPDRTPPQCGRHAVDRAAPPARRRCRGSGGCRSPPRRPGAPARGRAPCPPEGCHPPPGRSAPRPGRAEEGRMREARPPRQTESRS